MNKKLIRFIYSFFFLLFFIIAPILTFHALGYRYDFKSGQIEKTGAFYIKSFPRGADIFIDDLKMNRRTPNPIIDLRSGIYELRVEKPSYVSWTKKLAIESGQTTFAEDIVLFLQERPKILLGAGGQEISFNQQKNKYAYLDSRNRLIVIDVEQAKNLEMQTLDKNYQILDWSLDNQKILLKDEFYHYIFDINQRDLYLLNMPLVDKVVWENNSDKIIYLKDQQIFKHEISPLRNTSTEALNLDYKINDFVLKDNFFIIHHSEDNNHFIKQLNKNNWEEVQNINDVSLGKLDVLLANDDQLIFIIGSKLYIKSKMKDLIVIPITTVRLHGHFLLISNGYEIILYNYKDDWQELIDRSSQLISELLWHPNGSYFIYESNGQTYISELDKRDQRNIIKLLEDPRKKNYVFNRRGDRLFVLTPEENFYLTIQ